MGKHGEPDSWGRNIGSTFVRWAFGSVIVVVIVSVAGTFIYNHFWGADQAVTNDGAIRDAKDDHDESEAPALVDVSDPGKMWLSWVSPDVVDVAKNAPDYGFPDGTDAVHVGRPRIQDDSVTTVVSFDLTGNHFSTVRMTGLTAVVDERRTAPDGTVYFVRPQGDKLKGEATFDLGNSDLVDGVDAESSRSYLDVHTVTLDENESVGFNAEVVAPPDSDIDFHFEVSFDTGQRVTVDNEGSPFRIVSYPRSVQRAYMMAFDSTPDGGFGDEGIFPCDWPSECEMYANNRAPR